jgi:hypothetical protein
MDVDDAAAKYLYGSPLRAFVFGLHVWYMLIGRLTVQFPGPRRAVTRLLHNLKNVQVING